ncbi:hypothetical protein HMN09_01091800 [Mycena chlorophos]|uniref:Uncharacterized protein n=1 Tax=Mycena chlorophos TaxID=658473 RepID=A0A8H6SC65_MYCCL|nr:hypothetical protein HMN09_01091800 [Mycena chlorophos]
MFSFVLLIPVLGLIPGISSLPAPAPTALTTFTFDEVSFRTGTPLSDTLVSQTEVIIPEGTSTGANGAAVTTYLEQDIISYEVGFNSGSTVNALTAGPETFDQVVGVSSGGFTLSAVPTSWTDLVEQDESCTLNADGSAGCVVVADVSGFSAPITTTATGKVVPTTVVATASESASGSTQTSAANGLRVGREAGLWVAGFVLALSLFV